jgi:flagellar basal-body rod protein FlgB
VASEESKGRATQRERCPEGWHASCRSDPFMGLLDSVERLHAGLDYHLARQNLLTSNLAHLDTPDFKPLDLERTSAGFGAALEGAMTTTDPRHISAGSASSSAQNFKVIIDPTAAAGADGNGVSVDREAAKIAMNQVRYDALASLTSGELSGLAWAANDGRGG